MASSSSNPRNSGNRNAQEPNNLAMPCEVCRRVIYGTLRSLVNHTEAHMRAGEMPIFPSVEGIRIPPPNSLHPSVALTNLVLEFEAPVPNYLPQGNIRSDRRQNPPEVNQPVPDVIDLVYGQQTNEGIDESAGLDLTLGR